MADSYSKLPNGLLLPDIWLPSVVTGWGRASEQRHPLSSAVRSIKAFTLPEKDSFNAVTPDTSTLLSEVLKSSSHSVNGDMEMYTLESGSRGS